MFCQVLKIIEKNIPNKKILLEGIMIGMPAVIVGAYSISSIDEGLARKLLGILILIVFLLSFIKRTGNISDSIHPYVLYLILFMIGFIIGSFFGGYVGAMIAVSKSNKVIKAAYQFVTIVVAYKLLF